MSLFSSSLLCWVPRCLISFDLHAADTLRIFCRRAADFLQIIAPVHQLVQTLKQTTDSQGSFTKQLLKINNIFFPPFTLQRTLRSQSTNFITKVRQILLFKVVSGLVFLLFVLSISDKKIILDCQSIQKAIPGWFKGQTALDEIICVDIPMTHGPPPLNFPNEGIITTPTPSVTSLTAKECKAKWTRVRQ